MERQAGVLDRGKASNGTYRNLGDPIRSFKEVDADNVKSGESNDGVLGVGLAHSKGVGGVMPADSQKVTEGLEGANNQLQTERDTPREHRSLEWVETRLTVISEMAQKDSGCRFSNLAYLLNVEFLERCFWELRSDAAPGTDGVSWREYSKDLRKNLEDLVARMKAMKYRPKPVRRTYIPKDRDSKRPLGIPAMEDKIVQMGMSKILEAIYECDFLDVSYGFRPGRNCHQALSALDKAIMTKPVSYVLEADIKGFFDSVDHKKLIRCLEGRISDMSFKRLVARVLKSGVMEGGVFAETDVGTPQGGVVSPILGNIFLHYALDVWFERKLKGQMRGYCSLVRYADDFVICVQYKDEAQKILEALKARFRECGLELSKEKTRLVEFGRYAEERAASRKKKPGTFDFLGFTHFCGKTRSGKFKVGHKTSKKKFRAKVKAMSEWLRSIRCAESARLWWPRLAAKLRGHYQYYGISGNYRSMGNFRHCVIRLLFKWLNRRSQRRSFTWDEFNDYLSRHPLPLPRIYYNMYTLNTLK